MVGAHEAQHRHLGRRELGGDALPEVADRPPDVPGGKRLEVLERALLAHRNDGPADLEVAQRRERVVAQQGHARVAAHVPLLPEAAHGVDPDVAAVVIAPHN